MSVGDVLNVTGTGGIAIGHMEVKCTQGDLRVKDWQLDSD